MEIHSKDSTYDAEGCQIIGQTIKGIRLFFCLDRKRLKSAVFVTFTHLEGNHEKTD